MGVSATEDQRVCKMEVASETITNSRFLANDEEVNRTDR